MHDNHKTSLRIFKERFIVGNTFSMRTSQIVFLFYIIFNNVIVKYI